jgi:cysteine desulfurase
MRRIYLDHASTTPLDPNVLDAMLPFMKGDFGNPSALYAEGVKAKEAVRAARKHIAELLNVRSEEIVFTGSGTEADNLALIGVYHEFKDKLTPHFITTNTEHPGIKETMLWLEKQGAEVTFVPVEENGIIDPEKIKAALKPNTVLVSVMLANNEIGTIQPLREISRVIQAARTKGTVLTPYLHTDASQAGNYLDLSFQKLGVDMMTLDASKLYGPKGIGLLAVKKHVAIKPIIFGGGQEHGLRAGTENVPNIVGFAEAFVICQKMRETESERLAVLRDYFLENVINKAPNVISNGDLKQRLPNNINICLPNLDAEFAVIKLDRDGISCSAASACLNLSENSFSYVIDALGKTGNGCRESSLRFTLGRSTTKKDLDLTLTKLRAIMLNK